MAAGLSGQEFRGKRPRTGHLSVEAKFVAQPDTTAEGRSGHVADHRTHKCFEFTLVEIHCVPSSKASREQA